MTEDQFEEHYNALPAGYQLHEYRLDRVLGVGGFGITYLGWDSHLEKEVAIKEYLPSEFAVRTGEFTVQPKSSTDMEDYTWGLNRFLQEAQTLARFRHHSIVQVYRFFEAHGTAYMVMDYENGSSLSAIMKRPDAVFDEDALRALLVPLLAGLEEVHRANVLHRDIKPGNIFIRADGSPVLLDFGAARDAVGRKSKSLTSIVTPGYAPLEQYFGDGNQGPWTDIYAMGAILYQAITGKVPPEAPGRVKRDPYVPAVEAGAGRYGEGFLKAVDWALEVEEEERPQTVAQWRAAILGQAPATGDTMLAGRGGTASMARGDPGGRTMAPMMANVGTVGGPESGAGAVKWVVMATAVVLLLGGGGVLAWRQFGDRAPVQVAGADGGGSSAIKTVDASPKESGRKPEGSVKKPVSSEAPPKQPAQRQAQSTLQSKPPVEKPKPPVEKPQQQAAKPKPVVQQPEKPVQQPVQPAEIPHKQQPQPQPRSEAPEQPSRIEIAPPDEPAHAPVQPVVEPAPRKLLPKPPPQQARRRPANLVVCSSLLPALRTRLPLRDCGSASAMFNHILENGITGQRGAWRSRDRRYSGTLVLTRTRVRPDGIPCRYFRQSVTAFGRTRRAGGMACRDRVRPVWRITF